MSALTHSLSLLYFISVLHGILVHRRIQIRNSFQIPLYLNMGVGHVNLSGQNHATVFLFTMPNAQCPPIRALD